MTLPAACPSLAGPSYERASAFCWARSRPGSVVVCNRPTADDGPYLCDEHREELREASKAAPDEGRQARSQS